MRFEMKMPDLAANDSEIVIARWILEPGQRVQRGQSLLEVETDKVTMEVESAVSGVLTEVRCQANTAVSVGDVIAVLEIEPAIPVRDAAIAAKVAKPPPADERPASIERPAAVARSADGMFARNRAAGGPAISAATGSPTGIEAATAVDRPPESTPARSAAAAARYDKSFLLALYERMTVIRQFEEGVRFLFLEGIMPGTIHQCQGQEATAVGVCAALRPDDFITSTFRGHGHALAKGLTMQELLDELFGATTGCCKGKGGSMHVGNMAKGMIPGIAIVAGGIPVAAGLGLAMKMQKSHRVAVCFFGDGAVAEGAFHEGVNMAAIWNLPVVFVCENNLYGASTHIANVMRDTNITRRAGSYGIRGQQVDGNDVLAVYEAARAAVEECRAAAGPVLLELLTYRRTGHSRRDPCHYQPESEREAWFAQDPLERFGRALQDLGVAADEDLQAIKADVILRFHDAVEAAKRAPQPKVQGLTGDVFA